MHTLISIHRQSTATQTLTLVSHVCNKRQFHTQTHTCMHPALHTHFLLCIFILHRWLKKSGGRRKKQSSKWKWSNVCVKEMCKVEEREKFSINCVKVSGTLGPQRNRENTQKTRSHSETYVSRQDLCRVAQMGKCEHYKESTLYLNAWTTWSAFMWTCLELWAPKWKGWRYWGGGLPNTNGNRKLQQIQHPSDHLQLWLLRCESSASFKLLTTLTITGHVTLKGVQWSASLCCDWRTAKRREEGCVFVMWKFTSWAMAVERYEWLPCAVCVTTCTQFHLVQNVCPQWEFQMRHFTFTTFLLFAQAIRSKHSSCAKDFLEVRIYFDCLSFIFKWLHVFN